MTDKDPIVAKKRFIFGQMFFPLVIATSKFQVGLMIGWTAAIPKIQNDNSTTFNITESDVAWLISSPSIISSIGTLSVGPLIEKVGLHRLLLGALSPCPFLWILMAFTPFLSLIYFSRVGLAVITTVINPIVPVLTSELSEPKKRGFALATDEVVVSFGVLCMYVMVYWLPWRVATSLCVVPASILIILNILIPESPYWLVRNGKIDKAEKALLKLRKSKDDAASELAEIMASIKEIPQTTIRDQLKQLLVPENVRPIVLITSIFILRELSGQYIIFVYTVYLFERAGVNIDAFTCTVLVGLVRVVFSFASALLLDRVGRRPLLLITCVVCAASNATSGIFLLIDIPGASWVPLAAVLLYVSSYGMGLGPIPWGLAGEMLPTPVRSIGGSITIFSQVLMVFNISIIFPQLLASLQLGAIFILFAVPLIILTIVLWLWFPEIKGKSLNDVQDIFKSKPKNLDCNNV